MNPAEPGTRVAVGICGCGKTHSVQRETFAAAEHYPIIVIDRMCEWLSVPAVLAKRTAGAESIEAAAALVKKGARLVIARVGADDTGAAEEACEWACRFPGMAGVAIPEAHHYMPNGSRLTLNIARCVTAYRHVEASLFLDSQRFSLLDVSARDLSRELRCYAMTGRSDLNACDEIGRGLREQVLEAARRLAPPDEGGDDQPGWHVKLGRVRVPPFKLTREG